MPTDEENAQYLYLVLTHGGNPTIDWDPICESLDLNKGAATKRWSRLKQAMDKGEAPGASAYHFLWLCLKHSIRDKAMDWATIADLCGTTKGAASKRYSRLKLAFERGDGPPGTPTKDGTPKATSKAPPKSTPKKIAPKTDGWTPINGSSADPETPPPSVTKRKRAALKKKKTSNEQIKPEPEDEEDIVVEEKKAKRPKVTKKKIVPKDEVVDDMPNSGTDEQCAGMPVVKDECDGEDGEAFVDPHDCLQNDCV